MLTNMCCCGLQQYAADGGYLVQSGSQHSSTAVDGGSPVCTGSRAQCYTTSSRQQFSTAAGVVPVFVYDVYVQQSTALMIAPAPAVQAILLRNAASGAVHQVLLALNASIHLGECTRYC